MQARELAVSGAWLFSPPVFPDARGAFTAPFQAEVFARTVGHRLHVAQANASVSRRGALRGLHYADVPPGQAKYVQCVAGALIDVVVDLRVGSPTFGRSDAVRLDGVATSDVVVGSTADVVGSTADVESVTPTAPPGSAIYLPEGVGHAFLALADDTVTHYLCSTPYSPAAEHGLSPLDTALALPWADWCPVDVLILSDKDRAAPTLADALAAGALPRWEDCLVRADELTAGGA